MFRLMERDLCWSDPGWCSWLELVFACLIEDLPTGFPVALLHLWFCWFGLVTNEILQSLNPKDVERRSSSEASTLSLQELCRFTTDFILLRKRKRGGR